MEKVTHDAANRLIIVTDSPAGGLITIDVLSELYSASKREWLADDTLNRLTFPWVPEGGTVLPSGQTTPRSFILRDPWKLRPYEADHNLILTGNVFADTGSLTVPTLGNFRVEILSVFDVGLGDPRIQRTVDLLEADEEFTATTATRKLKGTSTVLLQKTVSGGAIANPPITLTE